MTSVLLWWARCFLLCCQCFFLCSWLVGARFYARGFFCYAEMFGFCSLPFLNVLGFMPTVFFLIRPARPPRQSISIVFMLTLCMENVIGRICKLCTCTRPGDPGTTGTDAMAFTCHDMFLEVPLKRCMVLNVATSLKLKRSPARILFMFTLTLCMECMECGGVVVRRCGVKWYGLV